MRRILPAVFAAALALQLAGCGGTATKEVQSVPRGPDLDADPIALLLADPIYVAKVDLHSLFGAGPLGDKALAPLTHALPPGMESTFVPQRDLDGILLASYAMDHVEMLAVVSGRFDPSAFDKAIVAKVGPGPHTVTALPFGGRTLYSSEKGVFVRLSAKTLLVGTDGSVRAALTRIDAGKPTREIPPWMAKELLQPGSAIAVAASFEKQPLTVPSLGPIPLSWVKTVRQLRAEGGLAPSGLKATSALTFADDVQARSASQGLTTLGAMANMLGSAVAGGLSLDGLHVVPRAADVNVSFDVPMATLVHAMDALSERAENAK